MIKAIFFDLDGVLIDMVQGHYIALNKALKDVYGFELTYNEHFDYLNGLPTKKKLEKLTKDGRIKLEDHLLIFNKKQFYTKEIINDMPRKQRKIVLHQYIKENKLYSVCVTNSIRETAELMLKQTGQFERLDLLISNEDIKKAKPNSEGYITAMVKFGVYPNECIIVEDSPHGYESAKNTGAFVWRVSGPEEVNLENFKKFKESIIC